MLLGAFSGALGYYNGDRVHSSQATLEMGTYLNDQIILAAEDYVAGNYLLARDRLVYILENNRDFSAAIELLVEVQVVLNMTATPPAPTATTTLTPTPDMRPVEEQYNAAVSMISLAEWDLALEMLSNIRKTNPAYRVIDVDGLMYLALRNRGSG